MITKNCETLSNIKESLKMSFFKLQYKKSSSDFINIKDRTIASVMLCFENLY